jgi:mono/diheme cytochrome c family protein
MPRLTPIAAALIAALPVAAAAQAGATRTGQQVYAATCAACHGQAGGGNGELFPPLAGSEWVNGSEGRVVRIIMHGLTGEIEVQGQTFSGMMPPWGQTLSDAEIANVATYIRSSFGNKSAPVAAATVAQIRKAHADRTTPWTAAELAKYVQVTK